MTDISDLLTTLDFEPVGAVDGRLVASFVQDSMIRDMPEAQRPKAGEKAKY